MQFATLMDATNTLAGRRPRRLARTLNITTGQRDPKLFVALEESNDTDNYNDS